ncbi:uncharacterized protein IL334_002318 [Kwoniella shivajii]|uniref:Uncharacterized protein n=1 Tax=Kwoniella shivajii TaxID=564305 RepID=A0ABZ1CW27_9TREE|nr:hypothetical protein IL334_002318 [Kwoniella shivajii]
MRRLRLKRRSLSGQGPPSPGESTNPSMASGSMDSYVSQDQGTSATSVSDEREDAEYRDIVGSTVTNPRTMSVASLTSTERQDSESRGKPVLKEKHLDKKPDPEQNKEGKQEGEETGDAGDEEVPLVDSPVSSDNEETQKTPMQSG